MDHKLRLAPNARLAVTADRRAAVLVMSVGDWPAPNPSLPLNETNVTIAMVRPKPEESEVLAALRALKRDHGVATILLEGGGVLAAAAIREGVVDRIEWFRAPILIGGDGKPALAGLHVQWLEQAPAWRRVAVRELGPDLWESYERAS
jgi:diaminohydroxyphosphoribosylaminopyrimidine deaminase/5-amino-6-(5-phosphoribosylamino)uracil reductase